MEPETETSPYRMTDPQAIALCDTLVLTYNAQLADFAALDSAFDAAFGTAWKGAASNLLQHPSFELTQDELAVLTQNLDQTMAQGSSAISTLRFFVQQAFGSNGIYRSFRFDSNKVLRHRPAQYAVYLRKLHRTATVHLAALQAKGLTLAHMQALLDAADAVLAAELDQEAYKDEMMHLTHQRNQLRQAMWAYLQKVNAAADVVFANDPVKRALFNVG